MQKPLKRPFLPNEISQNLRKAEQEKAKNKSMPPQRQASDQEFQDKKAYTQIALQANVLYQNFFLTV